MSNKAIALLSLVTVVTVSVSLARAGHAQVKPAPNQNIPNNPGTRPSSIRSGSVPSIGTGTGTVILNSAALCFTCGGNFPIYAGTIPTPTAASEYGSGCSGTIGTTLNDRSPYLCTK